MSKGKQATLFQSWGSNAKKKTTHASSSSSSNQVPEVINLSDLDDEDDDLLACALNESVGESNNKLQENGAHEQNEDPCNISMGVDMFPCTQAQSQMGQTGFDKVAGNLWIYPTNYPVREYQYNIVQQALFKNTMVTLPTGLGKTFIASVVMFNFYRWYPQGKIVFMAPTKPLVAQQIEACYNIMGIPQEHTAEMTGTMPPKERRQAWEEKRVFFLTPQVLTNDLSRGTCPAPQVKCVVVDEAHKALGNHAYCQVVRELMNYSNEFRVLALSATPGSDIKAVQQVLSNLLISHIELRTEESPDIKQYSFERQVDKIIVPFSKELTDVKNRYIKIMEVIVGKLKKYGVIYNREATSLSKFILLKSREAFRQNPPHRLPRSQYGIVEGDFALAISLYHGYELVQLHGLRSLYNFLDGTINGEKGHGRTRTELMKIPDFGDLMNMLCEKFGKMKGRRESKSFVSGHPKLAKLEEVVLNHFKSIEDSSNGQNEVTTRIMIFSQYRDSVEEITNMLQQHEPQVKAMSFIGQSSAGKATKGFTQKEQLKVMKKFREGRYNTLVATCVGEEGLDIGEVDLIICYDASKSPIRLVQRMGRTGRKRQGRIVMLVTQGKEEQIYNQGVYSKKSIHKAILNSAKTLQFYQNNPRMIPEGLDPKSHKMFITVKQAYKPNKEIILDSQPPSKPAKAKKASKPSRESDSLMTPDELVEMKELMTLAKPIPKSSHFLSLGDDTEENLSMDTLSYNNWMPWQNTLQSEHQISHSNRTKKFVDIVKFIELQGSVDENSYEEEMRLYLDPEDIVNRTKKNSNMEQHSSSEKDSSVTKKHLKKTRVRRSEQLPQFDPIEEESDDDLPVVLFQGDQNSEMEADGGDNDQKISGKTVGEDNDQKTSKQKSETNYSSVLLNKEIEEAQVKNRIRRQSEVKGRKKSSLGGRNSLSARPRRKRSLPIASANSSVVSIIADNDENDFEGVNNSERTNKEFNQSEAALGSKKPLQTILETYSKAINKFTDSNPVLQTVPEVITIDEDSDFQKSCVHDNDLESQRNDVDISIESAKGCNSMNAPLSPMSTDSEAFSIPEAPPVEELEEMINLLEKSPKFPEDLLPIVQEWEHEYLKKVVCVEEKQSAFYSDINIVDIPCVPNDDRSEASQNKLVIENNLLRIMDKDNSVITSPMKESSFEQKQVRENNLLKISDNDNLTTAENIEISSNLTAKTQISAMDIDYEVQPTKSDVRGHIESVDTNAVSDSVGKNKGISKNEDINFSDDDSFLHSPPNFDLSFSEVLVEQPTNSNKDQKLGSEVGKDSLLESEKTSSAGSDDKMCNKTDTVLNTTKRIINHADLNSYFDDSFMDSELQDAVLVQDQTENVPPNKNSSDLEKERSPSPNPLRKLSPKDDGFTFTQAMAVVHDSEEMFQTSDLNSEKVLVGTSAAKVKETSHSVLQEEKQEVGISPLDNTSVNGSQDRIASRTENHISETEFTKLQNKPERTTTSFSSSEEEEDLSALAQFDLGFDLDDVIPPSPCVSQSLSQGAFSKCRSILKSRKSLAPTYQSQEFKPSAKNQEDLCSQVIGDKDLPVNFDSISEESEKEKCSPRQSNLSSDIQEDFEQPSSPVLSGRRSISQNFSSVSEEKMSKSPSLSQVNRKLSPTLGQVNKRSVSPHRDQPNRKSMSPTPLHKVNRKSVSPKTSPSMPQYIATTVENFSSDEEVVPVKRKRKAVILDSPATPLTQKQVVDDFDTSLKPPENVQRGLNPVTDDDFVTPIKSNLKKPMNFDSSCEKSIQKKSRHAVSFALPPEFSDDDDDFEVDITALKKSVQNNHSRKGKNHLKKSSKEAKGRKSKSPLAAEFLEVEAEVSDEEEGYSCDEEEGSDLDHYEDSFIGDATQLSQRTSDNMQAIYLKSVKSPPVRGRFKLSSRHYNMDVYSQAPPEEESQYLEDSFVVDEEEEEEDSIMDDSVDEVTMLNVSELSCVGRRTRWSKPVKRTVTVQQKSEGGSKRRRIKVLEDSSSEGENTNNFSFENVDISHVKRNSRQALLSSSSEEEVPAQVTKTNKENLTLLKESSYQVSSHRSDNSLSTSTSNTTLKTSPTIEMLNSRKNISKEEQQRLERLQKQKEKQDEFRRKMAEKKAAEARKKCDGDHPERRSIVSSTGLILNSSSITTVNKDKPIILVDSREINGCQEIISELRFQHSITVKAAQLTNCDYIVSNRMGVDRQQWSEFTNGSRKDKLIERVTALCDLFDKPALIIEKDHVKADEKNSGKPLHWTKYVEKTLVHLLRSKVTLYFTDHQKDTARVLSEICRLEARKNADIVAPTDLDETSQAELRFYMSIPGLSYISALNLCHNYKSIRGFIVSDITQIMANGCLSKERASRIKDYLQRKFDPQMLPSGR
ncbi:Fanconi anemia group M protein-like [Saccostrea echinata]|uniref:Fanconi anemia group M protein-like n=1 Tax=Saccostrea echinata TaxID=191078 RepID=UPI002A81DF91|nr:Fanconi anemia group M protein-like [Saccostrea echinata]